MTPELLAQARQLEAEGMSHAQIAKSIKLSPSSILRHLGPSPNKPGRQGRLTPGQLAKARRLDQEGVQRKEIAAQLGVHIGTLRRRLGPRTNFAYVYGYKPRGFFKQERLDVLERALRLMLVAYGFSFRETGEALGATRGQVAGAWNEHLRGADLFARQGIHLRRVSHHLLAD